MVLLRQALGRGGVDGGALSYSDLNRRYVSAAAQRVISEQQMAVLQAHTLPMSQISCCTVSSGTPVRSRQRFYRHLWTFVLPLQLGTSAKCGTLCADALGCERWPKPSLRPAAVERQWRPQRRPQQRLSERPSGPAPVSRTMPFQIVIGNRQQATSNAQQACNRLPTQPPGPTSVPQPS